MRSFVPVTTLALAALVACGDSKPTTTTQTDANGNQGAATQTTETTGNTTVSQAQLYSKSSSSKMVQQSTWSAEEHADLSETATTETDDAGGTHKEAQKPSDKFTFSTPATVNLGAVANAFDADIHFRGNRGSNATVDGNVKAHVEPKPMPAGAHVDDGNLSLVLTVDLNRTLKNGDQIVVTTEPNLVVTKSGRRSDNKVTRTLTGKVHRALTSAVDANANFDLDVTHDQTTVVDTYASGALTGRVLSGSTTVQNNLTHETAKVTYNDLTRGKPSACLCPTAGSVTMVVTDSDGNATTHTYDFSGSCGAATVDITGSATAAAEASMVAEDPNTVTATAETQATAASAGNANASVHSTTRVHGELSWQDCLPTAE